MLVNELLQHCFTAESLSTHGGKAKFAKA